MTKDDPFPVTPMRPRPDTLQARIRELALVSGNVAWGGHARARMIERDITDLMMFEVLRAGHLSGDITAGKGEGEWKCKMVRAVKGRRMVGVVTMLVKNSKLFVLTVEWEDQK